MSLATRLNAFIVSVGYDIKTLYSNILLKADKTDLDSLAIYVSDTPPASPTLNMTWLDSDDGTFYFRYENGGDPVWVEFDSTKAAEFAKADRIYVLGAASDEDTPITVGERKITLRAPCALTDIQVKISLTTPQSTGALFKVDVKVPSVSIMPFTKITIDNGETTSLTATTPYALSSNSLADDQEIVVDVVEIGDGLAAGLKFVLSGKPV